MCQKKNKNNTKFRDQTGNDPPQSARSTNLFYPIIIMLQIFTEYSVIL